MRAPTPVTYEFETDEGTVAVDHAPQADELCRRVRRYLGRHIRAYFIRMSDGSLVIVRPRGTK